MDENIKKPLEFIAVFLGVFFLAALFLYVIDFVPEPPKHVSDTSALAHSANATSNRELTLEAPVHVRIPSAGIDTPIQNPTATDVAVLDDALLKGAVRYPDSALLGENATMYLFGHQSYLPVVHNQAFKAFNGLQKLHSGDEIIVSSAAAEYHYTVTSVELVDATKALVELGSGSMNLVLTTCDSFGKKTERYVVHADFVSRNVTGIISASAA